MKIQIEFDGYSDAVNDLTAALNIFLDNAPSIMMKAKTVKELIERLTPTFEEPATAEEAPAAPVEESPATEESTTPAEEDPATK